MTAFTVLATLLLLTGLAAAQAPALPNNYLAWVVVTASNVTAAGNTTEVLSIGQHVNVVDDVFCRYETQELFPTTHKYMKTYVTNFTRGLEESEVVLPDEKKINCTAEKVAPEMPAGGAWYLSPPVELLKKMVPVGYHTVQNHNCTEFQLIHYPANNTKSILQWYVGKDSNTIHLYNNQTFNLTTGASTIVTTAFVGARTTSYLNAKCISTFLCGKGNKCVARPGASKTGLYGALGWLCDNVYSCKEVQKGGSHYYPNTVEAHCDYMFNKYYQDHKSGGAGSCCFGNPACNGELVACPDKCTTCNVTATAKTSDVLSALTWVCGPQGIQNCSEIQVNGTHYHPNTLTAHADWAFNKYYQAYKCVPEMNPCDFGGVANVVPCNQ